MSYKNNTFTLYFSVCYITFSARPVTASSVGKNSTLQRTPPGKAKSLLASNNRTPKVRLAAALGRHHTDAHDMLAHPN
jgi:hypothetical protein